jgi:hypothetical protein
MDSVHTSCPLRELNRPRPVHVWRRAEFEKAVKIRRRLCTQDQRASLKLEHLRGLETL